MFKVLQRTSEGTRLAFLGLFAFLTRLPLLTYPKACDDEQVYAVVAMEMLRGGRPYIDAVERKPPLLFYLFEGLFRLGGPYHYLSLHIAALVWTVATMAVLYFMVRRAFDATAGFAAALLYGIFVAWADYTNLALNGELLMNLPVALALALTLRVTRASAWLALPAAGALIALAFLIKQPSVIAGLALVSYVLHPEYRTKLRCSAATQLLHTGLVAVGFGATMTAAALFLKQAGILGEAYYWSIGNHANALGPTTWFFWHKLPLTGSFFIAETLPLLLCAGHAVSTGFRGAGPFRTRRSEFAAFLALLAGAVLGVTANGQFLYHYFLQLILPLSLLAAPVLAGLWSGEISVLGFVRSKTLTRWLALTALLFLIVDTIGLSRNRVPKQTAVYIREHSTEDDRMFMWGQGTAQTGLYLDAQRRPATRYIASFPLNGLIFGIADIDTHYRIVPGAWQHLAEDFAKHPPKFIADCHAVRDGAFFKIRDYPFLRELLAKSYREIARTPEAILYERI